MKARKTKHFPLFVSKQDTDANAPDECPVCGSQIVSIGSKVAICPSCAAIEIAALNWKIGKLESMIARKAEDN